MLGSLLNSQHQLFLYLPICSRPYQREDRRKRPRVLMNKVKWETPLNQERRGQRRLRSSHIAAPLPHALTWRPCVRILLMHRTKRHNNKLIDALKMSALSGTNGVCRQCGWMHRACDEFFQTWYRNQHTTKLIASRRLHQNSAMHACVSKTC